MRHVCYRTAMIMTVIDGIFSLRKTGVNRHNSIKANWRTSVHKHMQGKREHTISQTKAKLTSEHLSIPESILIAENIGVLSKMHWRLSKICRLFKLVGHFLKCVTHLWFNHYKSRVFKLHFENEGFHLVKVKNHSNLTLQNQCLPGQKTKQKHFP